MGQYIIDLANRLRKVPVCYGVDGYDVERLLQFHKEVREAFKAGWKVNAVGPDIQPQEYLDGCEEADWLVYLEKINGEVK